MSDMEHEEQSARRGRRRWLRWIGGLAIVAGVLVALYPLGTQAYGWWAQRELRAQLAEASPSAAAAVAAIQSAQATTPSSPPSSQATASTQQATPSATATPGATATAGSQPAQTQTSEQAEFWARLGQFRARSEAFQKSVSGKGGTPIGQILIPSIGVKVVMVEGTGTGELKEGPGHWPKTPLPGQTGNFVVSGHRTTYGAPFRKLDKVKVGDEIQVVLPYAVVRYSVTRVIIVLPSEVDTVAQRGREQISLAACHPLHKASQRIVVQGDMIDYTLIDPEG